MPLQAAEDRLFCTEVYSTAFKYPLVDAKVQLTEGKYGNGKRWTIETPLDGTVYNLENGKVIEWCPRNNPIRAVLGTLKRDVPAEVSDVSTSRSPGTPTRTLALTHSSSPGQRYARILPCMRSRWWAKTCMCGLRRRPRRSPCKNRWDFR